MLRNKIMLRKRGTTKFLLSVLFLLITFISGWRLGKEGYNSQIETSARPENPAFNWQLFDKVWQSLNQEYVDRPLDAKKLFYGALKGLAAAVGDPYTAFLPPAENKNLKDSLNGRYEGIGAELAIRDNILTVVAPVDGSPAKKAGLRAGDKIMKIDGLSSSDISLAEAVGKIRGPAMTSVTLSLKRGEGDPFDLAIVREQITVKSVKWEDKGGGVVYIRVSRFGEATNKDWDNLVGEILTSDIRHPTSVVLDLRSNPGGYLLAAVHLASEFVKSGVIVSESFADGRSQEFKVDHAGRFIGIKTVVLLDEGSASASEILAAALKDLNGAVFVGKKSFGKGTVQDAIDFEDTSSLHVTVARWLTPSGQNIHEKGLPVDFEVTQTEDDTKNDRDPQLQKAVDIAGSD